MDKDLASPDFEAFSSSHLTKTPSVQNLDDIDSPILEEDEQNTSFEPSVAKESYGLERASEPEPLSIALSHCASEEQASITTNKEKTNSDIESGQDESGDELNTSNDSTDSDDTIIELSTVSQGLLSVDDDENTSDAFKEDLRSSGDTTMSARNMWMTSMLEVSKVPSLDASVALDISNKVKRQNVVPQNLLEEYLLMIDPRRADTEEKDITRHCAFAMPAVALTLGRDNWHVLRNTYLQLAQNYQWRVRRTLAYSMHQMASILGEEHAAADLLPLFKEFTVNEPECVRIGVLENLAEFVRVLPYDQRQAMLPTMKYFFGINDRHHRREFGNQLMDLLKLYPPSDCEQHLKLYCLLLLTDNVVFNRHQCHGLMSLLIERLGSEGEAKFVIDVCETLVKKFAQDGTWSRRQTFVFVVGRVFIDSVMSLDLYCQNLLPHLLSLAQDKVPNVRLAVAEVLSNHFVDHEYFRDTSNPETALVMDAYMSLQSDIDRDVRYFSRSPLTNEEVEAIHGPMHRGSPTRNNSSIMSFDKMSSLVCDMNDDFSARCEPVTSSNSNFNVSPQITFSNNDNNNSLLDKKDSDCNYLDNEEEQELGEYQRKTTTVVPVPMFSPHSSSASSSFSSTSIPNSSDNTDNSIPDHSSRRAPDE